MESARTRKSFEERAGRTLWPRLEARDRELIRVVASRHRLSFQQLRKLSETARDLEMWGEGPLESWWREAERAAGSGGRLPAGRDGRNRLLAALETLVGNLRRRPTRYEQRAGARLRRPVERPVLRDRDRALLGSCPVASEKTVCCNLRTLDAVESCLYGCSYCAIQTFYGGRVTFDARFAEKLRELRLDPARPLHIGTGQSSDSLAWGNRHGVLDALLELAARHPRVLLELKTKSANARALLEREVPPNVVASWSLQTQPVIDAEEPGTASLADRLQAARRVAERGIAVAFHFHPIVHHEGWRKEYGAIARRLLERFDPERVLFLSLGTLTFTRPVLKAIRERGGRSKISQIELEPDPHGKLSYPLELKTRLFRTLLEALEPWRERVFTYLCMERAEVWRAVLDRAWATNEAFERALLEAAMAKVRAGPPPSRNRPFPGR